MSLEEQAVLLVYLQGTIRIQEGFEVEIDTVRRYEDEDNQVHHLKLTIVRHCHCQ